MIGKAARWHRNDLSLRTVLRVHAMSKACEPIKARYSEAERQKWFADLLSHLKGRERLAWTNSPVYLRADGFSVRELNDRHYTTQAMAVMQGWMPVFV